MQALGGAWSPLAIQGLYGWWDASDTGSITSSSGAVSQWDDRSGHGKHLVQATGTNQPTTGSATQNGLNALSFDTNDFFSVTSFDLAPGGQAISVFAAFSAPSGSDRVLIEQTTDYNNTSGAFLLYRMSTNALWFGRRHTGSATAYQVWNSTDTVTTTAKAYVGVIDGRVAALCSSGTVNRNPAGTRVYDVSGSTNTSATVYVGARAGTVSFFGGTMCELGVVAGRITDTERMLLENYLMGKWAL